MTHGLTLGKFAPFHKGHQLLIESALAEVDQLTVVIYDAPETTPVPLPVRSAWIRKLYPSVHVIEGWMGPSAMGDTPEIKRIQEQYIIEELGITGITHFYSSEFYGEHMSRALGAVNRVVDKARASVSISGTLIRSNPYQYRQYLDPIVYRDLITNVVFLGAPSTGKTTISERLAREYHTGWMPEYGREYWEKNQVARRLTPAQMVEIAEGHLAREERILYEADRYLFTDTNVLTTHTFALNYHGRAEQRLIDLAATLPARYDLVFLCDTDIPYADTWDRSGEVDRQSFQKQIVADLLIRKIPFITLRGDLSARVNKVTRILNRYQKYKSISDSFITEGI